MAGLTFVLLASLALLLGTESANGADCGFMPTQSSAGSSSACQADNDVRELELGKPVERELAGGQHHCYQVSLASGQFLHAVVGPHGIAVTATLFGPDGKPMIKLAVAAGSSEPLFLVAKEQGIYRIEIRSGHGAAAGNYRVRIEELRIATPQDTTRALAQSNLSEGQRLHKEGTAASKQKAIEKYKQALSLWRAVGDRRAESETLDELGSVYYDLGEGQKAQGYLTDALALFRLAGDQGGDAQTLNNLGRVYDDLGERQKALDYYNQALPLWQTVGDRDGEARTLNGIGVVYDELGDRLKALDYYNQSLQLRLTVGDRYGQAQTLSNIGAVYDELGERLKALDYYDQALPLRRALGDRYGQGQTLNNMGAVYNELGQKQKALVRHCRSRAPWGMALGKATRLVTWACFTKG